MKYKFYSLTYFFIKILKAPKLLVFTLIFFCLHHTVSAQRKTGLKQTRTAQTVGTITYIYKEETHYKNYKSTPKVKNFTYNSNDIWSLLSLIVLNSNVNKSSNSFIKNSLGISEYNDSYTTISYLGTTLKLNYAETVYKVGDKVIIEYNPYDIKNAAPILDKPYFDQGELADTTEGIINFAGGAYCTFLYKIYNPSDSMDLQIISRNRYISKEMYDTLKIKENYIYKIIYNRDSHRAEILFHSIVDSTHLEKNKQVYSALNRFLDGSSVDAIRDLSACIQADSANAYYYYYQIAKAKENIREYKDAARYYTKYIEAKPADITGYLRRANVYIQMKNFDAAQKDVTHLLSLNYMNEEAHYLRGVIYYHKKQYQKAIDSYTNAINYTNRLNLQIYYYDRARAKEKLYGRKSDECQDDYAQAKVEAERYNAKTLHGGNTHEDAIYPHDHGIYGTLTSDNTFAFNSAYNSNMHAQLIVPYTIGGNSPQLFDKSFSLNHTNHTPSFALGFFSVEVGAYKRVYGRVELAAVFNMGSGPPFTIRSALGYNIKLAEKNWMILRPEMGFTYFNRSYNIGDMSFGGTKQINIMGKNFKYKTNSNKPTDQVTASFCENVCSLSPSVGLWLLPYNSKLVMRVGVGYNFVLTQNYSINFHSNNSHLRKDLDNLNIQFSNTNGSNNKFFSYDGFFINFGIGVRF